MILEVVITVALGYVTYFIINYICEVTKLRKYPPGPFPLPLVGNLHLISSKPQESFKKLAEMYGDVYSLSMGSERVVVVNNIECAREALIQRGADFAGRPTTIYTANLVSRNGKDIVFSDYGDMWKTFRKVAHQSLRMYGAGMENIESLVTKEIQYLEKRLDIQNGKVMDPFHDISNAVMNIICAILFGSRYEIDDFEFRQVVKYNTLLVQGFNNADIVAFIPWLRFFPIGGLPKLKEAISIRDPILKLKLTQHKDTYDSSNIRDFTDAVLQASYQEQKENSKSTKFFTDDHLTMILNDVFSAGAETTVTTIRWALVYFVNYPDTLQKAKEELKVVLGKEKAPRLAHRGQLPYLEAVIHETLRLSSLVPLGVPHKAIRDTTLNGHPVPKDTQVLFNVWAIHNDTRHWDNPQEFIPERWLDENGHFVAGRKISYLPFSAGRRVCLGEALAKTELFLFLSFLIHNYDMLPEGPDAYPDLEGVLSVTYSPKPYNIVFRKVESF